MEGADVVGPVGEEERAVQPLADRQRAILRWIQHHTDAVGYAPSLRKVADHFGIHYTTVQEVLRALQRKGYLESATPGGQRIRLDGRR